VRSRGVLPSLHHPVTRPFPTVSAFDVGKVAADLLELPVESRRSPRVIHVEGPRRYAAVDVAASFARSLGRTVTALELPRDQWAAGLAAGGLSEGYARLVMELQDAHNAGLIDAEPGGEVRRGTTELEQALGDLPSA
jgi:NAD(P)H dehydrogenase (quinone)